MKSVDLSYLSKRSSYWAIVLSIFTIAGLCSTDGYGQAPVSVEGRIEHEDIPTPSDADIRRALAKHGRSKSMLVHRGTVIDKPSGRGRLPTIKAPREEPHFSPDRITSFDQRAKYASTFNPRIAPFKRVSALDQVVIEGGVPTLAISNPHLRDVFVGGEARDSESLFWGQVAVELTPGSSVPIPSVAADARILQVEARPDISVKVHKNGSDIFFVSSPHPRRMRVRLTFLMAASHRAFGGNVPAVDRTIFAEQIPEMPRSVQEDGQRFAAELGIDEETDLARSLSTLVAHFRSFEETEDSPENKNGIFLDLARSKKGVCRHRAYAFVIAAQSIGIFARFVMNEAHAWVEVRLPSGWMRIDLGGAVADIDEMSDRAEESIPFQAPIADMLPKPNAYRRAIAEATMRAAQRATTQENADANRNTSEQSRAGERNEIGMDERGEQSSADSRHLDANESSNPSRNEQDDSSANWQASKRNDDVHGVQVSLQAKRISSMRAKKISLSGRVRSASNEGLAGVAVEVLLMQGDRERSLGVLISDDGGWFHGEVMVPKNVTPGKYQINARPFHR